jgi:ABC-type phosphate/phosphonate transport system substrate-binding protein
MKSTATVSVSVLASAMICGCVAASDDDFEQEDTGSTQQAVTVANLGSHIIANCRPNYQAIVNQLGDALGANAIFKLCAGSTVDKFAVIKANRRVNIYSNNGSTVKPNVGW